MNMYVEKRKEIKLKLSDIWIEQSREQKKKSIFSH